MSKTLKIIAVSLFLLIVFLMGIDYLFLSTTNGALADYLRGIATNVIGAFLTVVFIEQLVSRENLKEEKKHAREKIERMNLLVTMYVQKYLKYMTIITTTYDEQSNGNYQIQRGFDFKRLVNVFNQSLYMTDGTASPAYQLYFNSVDGLLAVIRSALLDVDFRHHGSLSLLLMEFIKKTEEHNPYRGIDFDYKHYIQHDRVPKNWLPVKLIEDHKGELQFYKPANVINNYIALYFLLNYHLEFIDKYRDEMRKLSLA